MRDLEHRAAFDAQGETYVRVLAEQNGPIAHQARAWLGEKQVQRDEAAAALRDAREEETLRLARMANDIAERSARSADRSMKISRIAAAVAAASVVVAVLTLLIS